MTIAIVLKGMQGWEIEVSNKSRVEFIIKKSAKYM